MNWRRHGASSPSALILQHHNSTPLILPPHCLQTLFVVRVPFQGLRINFLVDHTQERISLTKHGFILLFKDNNTRLSITMCSLWIIISRNAHQPATVLSYMTFGRWDYLIFGQRRKKIYMNMLWYDFFFKLASILLKFWLLVNIWDWHL